MKPLGVLFFAVVFLLSSAQCIAARTNVVHVLTSSETTSVRSGLHRKLIAIAGTGERTRTDVGGIVLHGSDALSICILHKAESRAP